MAKNQDITPAYHKGFIVALAWPATWCKQAGAWYDPIMRFFGINRNYFYQAGHAAFAVIDGLSGEVQYFDFGRYHSPQGYGRVRGSDTDHDLEVKTRANISEDGKTVLNFRELLEELANKEACHGAGALYGSYYQGDYSRAIGKAREMQSNSPIIYGPFIRGGTNCSRFVNTVIRAGLRSDYRKFRVKFAVPLTPTPLNNVKNLGEYLRIEPQNQLLNHFSPVKIKKVRYA